MFVSGILRPISLLNCHLEAGREAAGVALLVLGRAQPEVHLHRGEGVERRSPDDARKCRLSAGPFHCQVYFYFKCILDTL